MLRPEDRLQLHVAIGGQTVGGVHEGSVDGRRVGHDGDALAGNQLAIFLEQTVDAEPRRAPLSVYAGWHARIINRRQP